ncbi:caspase family protein [uncultured Roseibium sp.]|uniref:caspase family protein n=1 Tax=uncultured Roseibium sp. TaxID=1936171 RepID=UPI00261DCDFC|nr:caspase family protein [uncultured Roseibium sp.]
MHQLEHSAARRLKRLGLVLAALACLFVTAIQETSAAVIPGGNSGWLIVASRPNATDAINLARSYANRFPQTTVFQSNNGWYAVSLGWMNQPAGDRYKANLLSSGAIPGDSYFHNGQRFQFSVWSASGVTGGASQSLFASTRITPPPSGGSVPAPSLEQAYVSGLDPRGDNFLSLRTGPSTRYREIARMGLNTPLTILGRSGSWLNVALRDGRSGWAYGKYIASVPGYAPAPPTTSAPATAPPAVAQRSITPPRRGVVGSLTDTGDNFLSLRTGAGTRFDEIARLLEGTEITMLTQQGAWFEIELTNGMRGWAYGRYLEAAKPRQTASPSVPTIGPDTSQQTQNTPGQAQNEAASTSPKLPDLGALPEGKRVALVIGNSAYEYAPFLPNPKNDATDLMDSLKRLGFTVIVGLDQSKVAMEGTVRTYVRAIQDADVALFFYAGHAMQLSGKNYLIPIDAKLEDETAVDFETIELGTVLDYMNAPGRLSIALLDACRDNPLSRRFSRSLGASRSSRVERGLAAPQAGGGNILIGFATAPGEVALDGDEDNSPFTTALLDHIETPGLEIEIMMKRVKADVYDSTRGTQSPWHNSALRREFYFKN